MFDNNNSLLFNQYEPNVAGNMINKPEEKKSNAAEPPGNIRFHCVWSPYWQPASWTSTWQEKNLVDPNRYSLTTFIYKTTGGKGILKWKSKVIVGTKNHRVSLFIRAFLPSCVCSITSLIKMFNH